LQFLKHFLKKLSRPQQGEMKSNNGTKVTDVKRRNLNIFCLVIR